MKNLPLKILHINISPSQASSGGQVLGFWRSGKPPGRPQPGQDSERKTPGGGRAACPSPWAQLLTFPRPPVWAPQTDSSPLGRLGRQQPLLGVPTTGERLGQVSRSPLPSVQLGGRWQPSLLSREYKEMLPRQGPRTQGPVGHKLGQGVPCGLSVLRAAWQVPTQEAHLKTESHRK